MKKKTKIDYWESGSTAPERIEGESLMEIVEHLEELEKNPPKSKAGLAKLAYYKRKMAEYGT